MHLPNINPGDLWSLAADKINNTINNIVENITRSGKTLTIERNDGTTATSVDLAASPDSVVSGVLITQDNTDQRQFNNTAGVVRIGEEELAVPAGFILVGNGHATLPRIDALYIKDVLGVGVLKVSNGTAAAAPSAPQPLAGELFVGFVYVEPLADATTEDIYLHTFAPDGSGVYTKFNGSAIEVGGAGSGLIAADQAETNTGTNDNKFITPLKFANSTTKTADQATTDAGTNDVKYITPLKYKTSTTKTASQAETNAGTNDVKYVTPAKLTGFFAINGGFTYTELFTTITATTASAWHTRPAGVGNNKLVLLNIVSSSGSTQSGGARSVGSALDRRFSLSKEAPFTTCVKTDGAGNIQLYSTSLANISFKILSILE